MINTLGVFAEGYQTGIAATDPCFKCQLPLLFRVCQCENMPHSLSITALVFLEQNPGQRHGE
jgi:hypothetical protein